MTVRGGRHQYLFRIPVRLYSALGFLASRRGVSINALMVSMMVDYLEGRTVDRDDAEYLKNCILSQRATERTGQTQSA